MDSYDQANELLAQIELDLQQRVEYLSTLNQNYCDVLRALDLVEEESVRNNDLKEECKQYQEYNDAADSSSSDLEEILIRARSIREKEKVAKCTEKQSKQKQTKQFISSSRGEYKTKSVRKLDEKTQEKEERRARGGNLEKKGSTTRDSYFKNEPRNATTHENAITLIHAVDICAANYCTLDHPLGSVLPSRQLMTSQSLLLSSLLEKPSFPRSNIYMLAFKHFSLCFPGCYVAEGLTSERCLSYLKTTTDKLEREILPKLEKSMINSESDQLEVCAIWWNFWKCILAFESFIVEDCGSSCNTEGSNKFGSHIPCQSVNSPNSIKKKVFSSNNSVNIDSLHSLVSELVLKDPRLVDFDELFQNRVLIAVETLLSKLMLRPVLNNLKQCVEDTSPHMAEKNRPNAKQNQSLQIRWSTALKLFQLAYQILTNGESSKEHLESRSAHIHIFKKDITML